MYCFVSSLRFCGISRDSILSSPGMMSEIPRSKTPRATRMWKSTNLKNQGPETPACTPANLRCTWRFKRTDIKLLPLQNSGSSWERHFSVLSFQNENLRGAQKAPDRGNDL